LGDYSHPNETWFVSFWLPLWSILIIGFWNDLGRKIFKSKGISNEVQSIQFILWMSLIFTFVVWFHVNLQATQMLFVIPILGIPLQEWFIRTLLNTTWTPSFLKEGVTILAWAILCYPVYWLLTFCWILLRVWLMDLTSHGMVLFIQ